MRARLVGNNIWNDTALDDFGQDIRTGADEPDRNRLPILARAVDHRERFIQRPNERVEVTALQSLLDPHWIHFNPKKERAVHGGGEGLRAAHSAESAGDNEFSFERSAEMFAAGRGKSLERSLHNSLAADVNPGAGGHLSVHGQAHALEPIEFRVVRPMSNEI